MKTEDAPITIYPVILRVPEEKQALKGKDKVLFLSEYARAALARSAQSLGVRLPKLEKEENGAPIAAGGVYWSLSHKSGFVAAVAALQPVGIDIEKIRPVRDGMHEKIASETEWGLFPGDRLDFFYCWTAKEAVLKAAGVGIAGLPDCRIASVDGRKHLSANFQHGRWSVAFHRFEDHLAAVAANRIELCWMVPEEGGELRPC